MPHNTPICIHKLTKYISVNLSKISSNKMCLLKARKYNLCQKVKNESGDQKQMEYPTV